MSCLWAALVNNDRQRNDKHGFAVFISPEMPTEKREPYWIPSPTIQVVQCFLPTEKRETLVFT